MIKLAAVRRSVFLFVLMGLFIITVSIGADLRLLPLHFIAFPYYDKLGHFVLYGVLGLLLHLALRSRALSFWRLPIPMALLVVAALAVLDELQQSFMPARSFDAVDFAADMIGVLFFIGIANILRLREIDDARKRITINPQEGERK